MSGGGDPVGLCRDCRHARRVPTPKALYWRCARSETDPAFPKYPRLPVLACRGYEKRDLSRDGEAVAPDPD